MKFLPKTVLFLDFDGVLCNSELYAKPILKNLINKYFIDLDILSILPFVNGLNGVEIVNYLVEKNYKKLKGSFLSLQDIKKEILKDFNAYWSTTYDEMFITEEIQSELHTLRTLNFELILVSSASLKMISKLIIDIEECFSNIYTGDKLMHSKKDTRLWNHLKSENLVNGADYICIDDNVDVLKAAKKAGIFTFKHKYGDSLFSRFLGRSNSELSISKKPILLKINLLEFHDYKNIEFINKKQSKILDKIWSSYTKKNSITFDGPQAFVQGMKLKGKTLKLFGKSLTYKYILLPDSPLFRLAIQAIIIVKDKFIVGKRSKKSMDEVSSFEFIPAGGVENFSLKSINNQIFAETSEEIGFNNLDIISSSSLGACIDLTHKVIDLLYLIKVNNNLTFNNLNRLEHESVDLVNKSWIIENKQKFTISSKLFIDCFLLP